MRSEPLRVMRVPEKAVSPSADTSFTSASSAASLTWNVPGTLGADATTGEITEFDNALKINTCYSGQVNDAICRNALASTATAQQGNTYVFIPKNSVQSSFSLSFASLSTDEIVGANGAAQPPAQPAGASVFSAYILKAEPAGTTFDRPVLVCIFVGPSAAGTNVQLSQR